MPERRDPRRVSFHDLPGGARLVVQPGPEGSHRFAASYLGPAGHGFDPAGQEGLAEITAEALLAGTTRLDRAALFREIDRRGGALAVSTDPEMVHLEVEGPADEYVRLIGLLAEVLNSPRFAPHEIDRIRRELVEAQLRERQIASLRAETELHRRLFPPGHPYRESGAGTFRSVSRIRPSDLATFHRRHYSGRGGVVIVTHPGPAARLVRSVAQIMDRWPADRPATTPPTGGQRRPPSRGPARISLPGQSQVELRIGSMSLARHSPLYPAAELADELLGRRPVLSRLFQVIREREGLAYHASSQLSALSWGGYWELQAGTSPRQADRALRLLEDEIERLAREAPDAEELRRIRESAIGSIPLDLETTSTAHHWAIEIGRYGYPESYLVDWPERIRAITSAELQEAWVKGFDSRHAVIVLAGPISR